MKTCTRCNGKRGFYYGADVVLCPRCEGTGDESAYLERLARKMEEAK